jgi:hypothetical protein
MTAVSLFFKGSKNGQSISIDGFYFYISDQRELNPFVFQTRLICWKFYGRLPGKSNRLKSFFVSLPG